MVHWLVEEPAYLGFRRFDLNGSGRTRACLSSQMAECLPSGDNERALLKLSTLSIKLLPIKIAGRGRKTVVAVRVEVAQFRRCKRLATSQAHTWAIVQIATKALRINAYRRRTGKHGAMEER